MSVTETPESIIARTRQWIETVVVGMNFCPFAKREMRHNTVRFIVSSDLDIESVLLQLIDECTHLDVDDGTQTTLLILPEGFAGLVRRLVAKLSSPANPQAKQAERNSP